jgi:hypothetical protein
MTTGDMTTEFQPPTDSKSATADTGTTSTMSIGVPTTMRSTQQTTTCYGLAAFEPMSKFKIFGSFGDGVVLNARFPASSREDCATSCIEFGIACNGFQYRDYYGFCDMLSTTKSTIRHYNKFWEYYTLRAVCIPTTRTHTVTTTSVAITEFLTIPVSKTATRTSLEDQNNMAPDHDESEGGADDPAIAQGQCDYGATSIANSAAHCKAANARLCSVEEIQMGNTINSGTTFQCDYSSFRVWTSTTCATEVGSLVGMVVVLGDIAPWMTQQQWRVGMQCILPVVGRAATRCCQDDVGAVSNTEHYVSTTTTTVHRFKATASPASEASLDKVKPTSSAPHEPSLTIAVGNTTTSNSNESAGADYNMILIAGCAGAAACLLAFVTLVISHTSKWKGSLFADETFRTHPDVSFADQPRFSSAMGANKRDEIEGSYTSEFDRDQDFLQMNGLDRLNQRVRLVSHLSKFQSVDYTTDDELPPPPPPPPVVNMSPSVDRASPRSRNLFPSSLFPLDQGAGSTNDDLTSNPESSNFLFQQYASG